MLMSSWKAKMTLDWTLRREGNGVVANPSDLLVKTDPEQR